MDEIAAVGALEVTNDLRPARWLIDSVRSFAVDVGSLVPDTFPAYARILHPAYAGGEVVRWAQIARANGKIVHPQMQFTRLVGSPSRYAAGYRGRQPGLFDQEPDVGSLPPDAATSLVEILAGHTTTADRCWFAVWNGYADLDPAFPRHPTFPSPNREYCLACGPLAAAAQSLAARPGRHRSANLWWPDDHAWCVATEIDLDSTYLGASEACIGDLVTNLDLEVLPIDVTAGVTADSDTLN